MFKIKEGSKVLVKHGSEIRVLEGTVEWANKDKDRGGWSYMCSFGGDMGNVHESEIQCVEVGELYTVTWLIDGMPGAMSTFERDKALRKQNWVDRKGGQCWTTTRVLDQWVAYE